MFSIGVDIVQIKRIEKLMEKNYRNFYKKLFTEIEIKYIENNSYKPQTIAGLFSAKEAIAKAIGCGIGRLSWQDIEIIHNKDGKPMVNINERLKALLEVIGKNSIEISISHEKDYAIAFAICFKA